LALIQISCKKSDVQTYTSTLYLLELNIDSLANSTPFNCTVRITTHQEIVAGDGYGLDNTIIDTVILVKNVSTQSYFSTYIPIPPPYQVRWKQVQAQDSIHYNSRTTIKVNGTTWVSVIGPSNEGLFHVHF